MFVEFRDMHSGGDIKLPPVAKFYIEAEDEQDGIRIFKLLFKRDPYHVTCNCCGPDYAIDAYDTLEEATAYGRGCKWVARDDDDPDAHYDLTSGQSMEDFLKRENVRVVFTFPRS